MNSRKWLRKLIRKALPVLMMGAVMLTMWLVDNARRSLEQADAGAYRVSVADSLARSGTDGTIELLQNRLRLDANDQSAYTQLGLAYLQKARESGDPTYYTKAEEALNRALELRPDDFAAMAQLGALALARHDFQQALEWAKSAQAISPDTALLYGILGDAQLELGQYDAALESFQTMVDLRPDLSSYSRASYLRELHGDVDGAIEAMQSAVRAGGPNAENTNWTRVQLGNLYFNTGRLSEAEAEYNRALNDYPGYVHALAGLGRVHAARGEYDQAIELYTTVTQRIPLPEYVIALGDVYEAAGRHAEAQQQFKLVNAIAQLYQANGVDTDLEMALFDADHSQGKVADDVLARAQRASQKRPTLYAASVLAWTLYQDGQYEPAYELAKQSLRLGTQDALLFFHAGMIAQQLGHTAEAQSYLEQALALNPNFSLRYRDVARQTLDALQQAAGTMGR